MSVGDTRKLGFYSFLGTAQETAWGTAITATAYLEFNSESINKVIDRQILDGMNCSRNPIRHIHGNENISGSVEFNLNPAADSTVHFLRLTMGGTITSAGDANTGYSHTFTQGDFGSAQAKQGLTLQIQRGQSTTGDQLYQYSGVRVNQMTIKGEIDNAVIATCDVIGRIGTTSADSLTCALPIINPFNWKHVEIRSAATVTALDSAGVTETCMGFELSINNNLISDNNVRSLGHTQLDQLPAGKLEVMLKLTQRYDTFTAYNRGNANSYTAYGIYMISDQTAGSAAGGTTYSMIMRIPRGYAKSNNVVVGGPDVLTEEYEIQSIGDTAGAQLVQMVINNATASY